MSDNQIKAGDVVRLKSGGPAMTVSTKAATNGAFNCSWFVNQEHRHATFYDVELTKIKGEGP